MKKFTASTQSLALAICTYVLTHGGAQASPLTKRMPAVKPHYTQVTGEHVQKDRIIIKFKEGTAVRLRGGKHVSR